MRIQNTLAMTGAICALWVAPATTTHAANEGGIEEIVVTAQKREERLQDVPVSITAIEATGLAQQNSVRIQDYLANAPGVSIAGAGSGRQSVVIRGVSTGIGNNPTTGITIDDVPFGSSTSSGLGDVLLPDLDPSDLARIEVLRGPQGTLYGASSMGGLVKFVTLDPSMETVSARAQVDASSVENGELGYGVRGSVNVPLIADRLAMRASGFYREDAGVIDDPQQGRSDVDSAEVYGGRLAALWNVASGVDVRLSAMVQDRTADASATQDVRLDGTPAYGDLTHRRLPGTDGFEAKIRFYTANVTADLGGATLTAISGYGQIENDYAQDVSGTFGGFTTALYGSRHSVRVDNHYETDKFSQEIRLASGSGAAWEWQVGAFYTREESTGAIRIAPVTLDVGTPVALDALIVADSSSIFKEYAGFGDLTYRFSDRFDVTVGARYSSNDRDFDETDNGLLIGPVASIGGTSSDSSTTYLITPRFHISDDLMAYARVATGYRVGGPNSGAPAGVPRTFDADETVNYELGVKGTVLERRLSFDAAVFYIDWNDIQIRQVDPRNGFGFYGNGGTAKSQGAEFTTTFMPLAQTKLTASASYTDAKLTEDGPPGVYAPAGSRLPNSSKWSATIALEQTHDLSNDLTAFGTLSAAYTGDRIGVFNSRATAPRFEAPSYTTGDLQMGVRADRWTATVFVRNLTDERGYLNGSALNAIAGQGLFYATIIQPRTIGLSLVTEF